MSRVIKFRAWTKDWDGVYRMSFSDKYEEDEIPTSAHQLMSYFFRNLNPNAELMQFTGLHDKNGIEIYEGDILSFFGDPIAVVEWQDFGGWSYRWIGSTYERVRQRNPEPFFTNINLWSVIGNIYQNPELLNPTQP